MSSFSVKHGSRSSLDRESDLFDKKLPGTDGDPATTQTTSYGPDFPLQVASTGVSPAAELEAQLGHALDPNRVNVVKRIQRGVRDVFRSGKFKAVADPDELTDDLISQLIENDAQESTLDNRENPASTQELVSDHRERTGDPERFKHIQGNADSRRKYKQSA